MQQNSKITSLAPGAAADLLLKSCSQSSRFLIIFCLQTLSETCQRSLVVPRRRCRTSEGPSAADLNCSYILWLDLFFVSFSFHMFIFIFFLMWVTFNLFSMIFAILIKMKIPDQSVEVTQASVNSVKGPIDHISLGMSSIESKMEQTAYKCINNSVSGQ